MDGPFRITEYQCFLDDVVRLPYCTDGEAKA